MTLATKIQCIANERLLINIWINKLQQSITH